jgi:hypothetical protein
MLLVFRLDYMHFLEMQKEGLELKGMGFKKISPPDIGGQGGECGVLGEVVLLATG